MAPDVPMASALPTSADLAGVFGRTAASYDAVIPYFATFGHRLVELAELAPGECVLDVASGRGASLVPAREAVGPGGTVVGIDLAPEMVDGLSRDLAAAGAANASVQPMDAEDLTFPDASFDVVVCGFTLQLLPDPPRAAAGFFRVLRPGGRCAVSTPLGTSPAWGFLIPMTRRFAARAARPMPAHYPQRDLVAYLRDAGFGDVRLVDEEMHFTFPDEEGWWRWAWATGLRAYLEVLPPDALEDLKAEAFAELRSVADGGLTLAQHVRFVLARRSD